MSTVKLAFFFRQVGSLSCWLLMHVGQCFAMHKSFELSRQLLDLMCSSRSEYILLGHLAMGTTDGGVNHYFIHNLDDEAHHLHTLDGMFAHTGLLGVRHNET